MKELSLKAVNRNERLAFEIWHDRFVNEYNRSQQARQGHILNLGTPEARWNEGFENNIVPLWVKCGNRNIGYVSPQELTFTISNVSAEKIQIISDVYIDPKFRGRGLLASCLISQREIGREAILIDEKKLLDNAGYYYDLGFKFAMHWPEQELLIVSPKKLIDDAMWFQILPDKFE